MLVRNYKPIMSIKRKGTTDMSQADWDAYNGAVKSLFDKGLYAALVNPHAAMDHSSGHMSKHRMHGSMDGRLGAMRFLPWHRAYLIIFERALRRENPLASIPYWDWIKAGRIPEQVIQLPNNARHNRAVDFVTQPQVDSILSQPTYYEFTDALEVGPHNEGHNFIGGIMANPMFSPRDSMFWLHHANVDRLWYNWQRKPENRNKIADITQFGIVEKKLDPWESEFSIDNINDALNLGGDSYEYA